MRDATRRLAFSTCSPAVLTAWLAVALLGVLGGSGDCSVARAQSAGPDVVSARSVSGQFTILSRRSAQFSMLPVEVVTNRNFLHLDPMLLPSSCERIRQALWRTLGTTAPWRGQIYIALHPAFSADETVTVISQRFQNGWQYRVELPDTVQRLRYARAMVEVLLLEIANRSATEHSAEIPKWLTEGLTRQLLATSEAEFMLQPPRPGINGYNFTSTLVEGRRNNPLAPAHREFLTRTPLSFEELSWPTPNQLGGAAGEFYADSAQLFVNQLMGLRDGRTCLRAMVEELPQRYNWQFAFLHAFGTSFQRPLDVEKWWALQVVHFTGRDLTQTWPEEEGWAKLDQAIRSAVEIRTRNNQLPLSSEVSLQTIIGGWTQKTQTEALQGKVRELTWLRPRLARDQAALADDYCKVIQTYLESRDRTGRFPFRKSAVLRQATQDALRDLGMLDTRRIAFKPKPKLPTAIQAQAIPPRNPAR